MSDDTNDTAAQDRDAAGRPTPPPLISPPARRPDDNPDDGMRESEVSRDVAAEPVFVEPTADGDRGDRAPGDTRADEPVGATTVSSSDDDLNRDDVESRSASSVPYQPVSAVRAEDDRGAAPTATDRNTPDYDAYLDEPDRATEQGAASAVAADAETVVVANPSTSPAAAPQPVFVPASDGGTERTVQYAPIQREFVQAPVPPKKKGNRGIGSLIAVLSVIGFAVLYALIAAGIIAIQQPQGFSAIFTNFLINPLFWVPAIIFVVAFILVVLLANRAAWWAYVLGSLLVGALVYFGTIGAAVLSANIFTLTASQAVQLVGRSATDPFIIAAGLVAREVSLWTGSAISARGRRVKARNVTAREDYERAAAEHRAEYERSNAAR